MRRSLNVYLLLGAFTIFALYESLSVIRSTRSTEPHVGQARWPSWTAQSPVRPEGGDTHVASIGQLIANANNAFDRLSSKQPKTLKDAAEAYRLKRGRHPPPGFEKWYEYAAENNAIIVEDFFDQIYHDLEPFWALPPAEIRAKARQLEMWVRISNGTAEANTGWFWHVIWADMIGHVSHMLPDMIVPLNAMDEPRIMVPHEIISASLARAKEHRTMADPERAIGVVHGWPENEVHKEIDRWETTWYRSAPYSFARAACAPDAPIRAEPNLLHRTMGAAAEKTQQQSRPETSFVSNWTLASDLCQDSSIGAYHGALTSPLTASTSRDLLPMFGGSKFAVNNDILMPAPMYWNGEERFDAKDHAPWSSKTNLAIWRGTATGGRHNALNWPNFHRHRFVALTNGTKYRHSFTDPTNDHDRIFTDVQQQSALSPLPKALQKNLESWLDKHQDIKFTDLFCDIPTEDGQCWYLSPDYEVARSMGLPEQYSCKFLPDVDGNSFSGRYRSFLQSNSVPIKASLYREWHDHRLVAWKHFVPMNNRFTDYYAIMSYFLGCTEDICGTSGSFPGHDSEAEEIARAGSEWAQKVLRKVDMQIYVARLLLEYGRLTDDKRDLLGWVTDLKSA